jgi:acetyl-CoA synthetase
MASQEEFDFGGDIVWRPSAAVAGRSNLQRFMERHGFATFQAAWQRSIEDVGWFWEAVLEDLGIEFYEPYDKILDLTGGIQFPQWCVGGKLNVVHNCLDKWIGTETQNRAALRWEGETGRTRTLTYRDLWAEVNRCANALRAAGLGKGDGVGLYMPLVPEIAVALLAIAKIGGIILPLFSGFGSGAVATRLADAGAKALFTCDGAHRRGRVVPMKPIVDEALPDVPSVRTVVVFKYAGNEIALQDGRDVWWAEFMSGQPITAPTEVTEAEDALMVIYTSGTTGPPKGALHTHCGFPVKSAHDMAYGLDIHAEDTLYWMTDMGWMMGPWLVIGTLLLGATMLLYDGAPDYPDVDRVWSIVERHGVTALGVAPTFARALVPHGDEPIKKHDLSSLRVTGSTGEAWNPDPWLWFFRTVCRGEIPIINYSGGTEISGGIVMGNVVSPLKPCAFSGPLLGMAADVVDDEGQPLRNAVGELVIRQPWIGMTRGFWKDPQRYLETYWSRFPDVWVHGDFAAIDSDGLWYILGRSDDTINVAGKRLGPAEVESILVSHPLVAEAAAVGVPDALKGQAIVCFCVLQDDVAPAEDLRTELIALVIDRLGKPLAPKAIRFVSDIPKTRNAKVMRRVVRAAFLGEAPGDLSALVNPEAVEEIRNSA